MALPRRYKVGLVICALLGVGDVVSIAGAGADEGPPAIILAVGLVLGIVTLVGTRSAWGGDDKGFVSVVVSRVLSALSGIPAFFADEAPDWGPVAVGVGIVVTALALWLLYSGRAAGRRPAVP